MKIKYKTQTGEIICMGDMPLLQAGNNEVVADVSFDIPSEPLNYFTFDGFNLIRKDQSVIDAMNAVNNFDVNLMLGAMGLTFTGADSVLLAPYLSAIQNYASAPFRNFKGIKDFIAGLVLMGKATQGQADSLKAIFAQQGIDLASY